MPRKMRVQYHGAMYHLMSRGGQRDDIFFDDVLKHDPHPPKRSPVSTVRTDTSSLPEPPGNGFCYGS